MEFTLPKGDHDEIIQWSKDIRKQYTNLKGARFQLTVQRRKPELTLYGFTIRLAKGAESLEEELRTETYNKKELLAVLEKAFSDFNCTLGACATKDLKVLLKGLL